MPPLCKALCYMVDIRWGIGRWHYSNGTRTIVGQQCITPGSSSLCTLCFRSRPYSKEILMIKLKCTLLLVLYLGMWYYLMTTIVNTAVWYIWSYKDNFNSSHYKVLFFSFYFFFLFVSTWDAGYQLNLWWQLFHGRCK